MEMELHSTLAESRDAHRKQDRLDRVRNEFKSFCTAWIACLGMQGWCSGWRCVPGSIPGPGVTCGLSLSLVLVPAPRVFSGFSGFPPSTKTNTPIRSGNERHRFVSFAVKCYPHLLRWLLMMMMTKMTKPFCAVEILQSSKSNSCYRLRPLMTALMMLMMIIITTYNYNK